jgi:Nif-specific regulatory protein
VDLVEDVINIGRADSNELVLRDDGVFATHAKLIFDGSGWSIVDRQSSNATWVDRALTTHAVDATPFALVTDDAIRFGVGGDSASAVVEFVDDIESARVVVVRKVEEIVPSEEAFASDPKRLHALYAVQKRIGGCSELSELLNLLCDEIFALVRGVTHITLVLRDDDGVGSVEGPAAYVPVVTRVRGASSAPVAPIPISRSVYRKVIAERVAVLAADAPSEVGQTESLLSAHIRAVIGVPLWR